MKGLAALLAGAGSSGSDAAEESGETAKADETGGSARKFARLAAEAIADGDIDAAADALVSLKNC